MVQVPGRSGTKTGPAAFASRRGDGDVRLSRWLTAMNMGMLAALIALVVASLLWVSDRHNALAREAAEKMVRTVIGTFAQKMEIVVRDYSIWDEAVQAIATRDTDWLHSSLGSAASEIGTFDLLHLYDPNTGWSVGWVWGTPVAGTSGLVPDHILTPLENRLAETDPTTYPVVTAFAELYGEIWGFAITRVVPMSELDPDVAEGTYARQIHGMILSEDRLDAIGEAILMEDLRLTSAVPEGKGAVPLMGLAGTPVGHVVWDPPAPGERILRQVAVPIGLGLLAMVAIALVSSRLAVRSARRLETALADARAADRAKSEFLSNVSHELRTPMNGILGVVQLLEMTRLDAEQRELVDILQSSADTQMSLIGDLLDVIQLENGQRQLSSTPVVPADVALSVVNMLRPAAEEKGLQLQMEHTPEALVPVLGDARAIKQIITNLLGNAVKFTGQGSVALALEARARGDTMELRLSVQDTGPGIAPEHQARIFERFAQVDAAPLSRAVDGIGIGLAISQALAQRMGGVIALQSRLGEGACFTFTVRLPVARSPAPAPALAEAS